MLETLGEKSRLVKDVSSISLYIQYPPVIPPDVNAVLGSLLEVVKHLRQTGLWMSRAVRVVLFKVGFIVNRWCRRTTMFIVHKVVPRV